MADKPKLPPLPKKKGGPALPSAGTKPILPPLPKKAGAAPAKKQNPALGLLGAVGSALSMPQQVLFKVGKGVGEVVEGHPGAGAKTVLGALGEIPTLGQAGGDISFSEAITPYEAEQRGEVRVLPKGLNTAVEIAADPLNVVTFGTGTVAKKGLQTTGKVLGTEAVERVGRVGLKKGLTTAEQKTLRKAIVAEATEAGVKNAEKTADRTMRALAKRGQGGVVLGLPGTDIGGSVLKGTTAKKVGKATGLTAAKGAVKSSAPVRFLGRAVIPGRAVSEALGSEAGEQVLSAQRARLASGSADQADMMLRIKSAVRDFEDTAGRKFDADDDKFVQAALESGDIPAAAAARPDLARVINTADDIRRTIGDEQVRAGVLKPETLRDADTYLHRVITPEATKAFGRAEKQAVSSGGSVQSALRQGAAKARTIAPERTVQEINAAVDTLQQGGKLADGELENAVSGIAQMLKPGEKLYDESALNALVSRGSEAHRAIATADYISDLRALVDDTGERILMSADDVAQGAEVPANWVKFDLGKLGTFHAPAALKAEITKFHAVIGADDAVESFAKFLKGADKWWKTMVTVYPVGGLAFGARNARSNAFLTFADGMAPHWFGRGLDFQRKISRVKKDFAADIADLGPDAVLKRELGDADFAKYRAAVDNGVIGAGYFDIDIAGGHRLSVKGAPKQGGKTRRAVRAVAGTEGAAANLGRRFNQSIEQNARLSHFLYSVDRLGNLKSAAERTNTVLFDYGRVTPFEQKVIKRVVPFWTFASRVVPAQFRAIVENPARVIVPEKISRATTDPLPENAPEYQRRGGARISKFGPFAGLITTPERPLQAALRTLEPSAQLLAATLPGKQGILEPEHGVPQAFRSALSQFGGAPGAQIKFAAEEAGNVDLFTGFRLADEETRQRLLAELFPPLGRTPRIVAKELPESVVEKRRKKDQPTLAEFAQLLGIRLEKQTKAKR